MSPISKFPLERESVPTKPQGDRAWVAALRDLPLQLTGLRTLQRLYRQIPADLGSAAFLDAAIALLNIEYDMPAGGIDHVPRHDPVVVVANHPSGMAEGIVLAKLLLQIRPDVKFLANHQLKLIPELAHLFLGIKLDTDGVQENIIPLRSAIRWVRKGGLLAVFPAGEVAHRSGPWLRITESPWLPGTAKIIRATGAAVVPVHINARNSELFHWAGLAHSRLRTLLLPRELLQQRGKCMAIRFGTLINAAELHKVGNDGDLARYLQSKTMSLGREQIAIERKPVFPAPRQQPLLTANSINAFTDSKLQSEIMALPPVQLLAEIGSLKTYYASASQAPRLLQEIGRLRELTFRAVGEGTGHDIDLDIHDAYYTHLFVWDETNRTLVGAYRMGLSDLILSRYGLKGLYTHSLFKFSRKFLNCIQPSIELGRSFIRDEYQRNFTPLLLLWKGIGTFVARNPRYRYLFGPVSISSDYSDLSRQLLVHFLEHHYFDRDLARQVKARCPFKNGSTTPWRRQDFTILDTIEKVSEVVAQLEPDGKGMPVLLRQYLKLGGTLLGFNIDHNFNDALDGLIVVDLLKTHNQTLQKCMGIAGWNGYLAYHRARVTHAS